MKILLNINYYVVWKFWKMKKINVLIENQELTLIVDTLKK